MNFFFNPIHVLLIFFFRKQDILDKTLGAIPEDSWSPDAVQQIRDEIKTFILAGI